MKNVSKILGSMAKSFKVLMINTIIFSLIQSPFTSQAFAAGASSSSGGFGAADILNVANASLGLYSNFLGQKQQMLQQQINTVTNQRLMAQMGPTCRKPDGTACFSTPAKMFPDCTLPASMSNMPANVCTNPTPEVNQISSMLTYESIAQGWMNYYDQMNNEASNVANSNTGISCLKKDQKTTDDQLIAMINSLQRLQDKLNQDKQIFRDNNKVLLENMKTANDELFGSKNNNLNTKTQDFAKFFSQSCQSVIGKDALNSGTASGLNGIVQGLSSTNKAAADFSLNKNVIEADAQREASRISALINGNGVDDFLITPLSNSKIFSTIPSVIDLQVSELKTARARITKELAAVGYTPPAMDKNFSADIQDFETGAADYFRKQYINDCVTGASMGVAIPIEDILNSLQQKSTGSQGTARNDYRAALKKILSSDAMIEDKMQSIKDLEASYSDITVTYKDSSSSRVTDSPYNLFMKTILACKDRYTQDGQITTSKNTVNGAANVSYQKKVERGRAALQELKNLNDNFASKITQAITDKVLNCDGEAAKSGTTCSEASLQTTDANFCVAHASVCANDIQGCYAEANTQVQVRKTKMVNLAKTFNNNVAAMITSANALFEQQKAAVTSMTQFIQTKFPGTNFEIPKDMIVTMPELSSDTFGVPMAGDGDTKSFLDGPTSMPAKIDKLILVFQKQKDTVDKSVEDYIGLQTTAMEKQRGLWEKLATKCQGAIDSSSRALAKMNQDGLKNQAEQDANVAKFCKKYNSISKNPVAACGQAQDLADLATQAGARLSGQAETVTQDFAVACDGYMNQSDTFSLDKLPPQCQGTIKSADEVMCRNLTIKLTGAAGNSSAASPTGKRTKPLSITALCGSGSSKSDTDFFTNVAAKLSADDKAKLADVSDLQVATDKTDSDENYFDGGFLDNISKLTNGASSDICAKIKNATSADTSLDSDITKKNAILDSANTAVTTAGAAATPEMKKAAADAVKDLKISTDAKSADSANIKTNKKLLEDSLAALAAVTGPAAPPSQNQMASDNVMKIGQQATGPCDMQSNSNITKNMGFDLGSFDSAVLGAAR